MDYNMRLFRPIPLKSYHEYPFFKEQKAAMEKKLKAEGLNCSVEEFCRDWAKLVAKMK